ncbi:peptidylprolyl isomerase [uncultured Bacteroides sp.]|uniref:peptidylprolyl isomerase n=1 Tax=uncultured Bacteroides sp. TaxID=162156 RepID=UPI00262FA2D6|nr:peptidylprolyl isomerase [uncultured Bacteroides sp.]
MKKVIVLLTMIACCITACTSNQKKTDPMTTSNETLVRLETTEGNITVKLYNETPKHRDNFIKLVKEGVYDSTLFHRVIKNFMIQAGDPQSKTATDTTTTLGSGDVGYTIPAEIKPDLFHKKGVLAAARLGDEVNPNRESSGCQFYIVTGRTFSEAQLINMERQMNDTRLETVFQGLARNHMKEIYKMRKANDTDGLIALQDTLEAQAREIVAKEPAIQFTKEQITAYTTVGGAPHLDGAYTVFGEVVDGMDIVDKIEKAKTNRADRPEKDIRILKATIVE